MKRHSLLSLLLGFLLCVSLTGYAQQAPPSADTYVASSKPTASEGAATILAVQPGVTSFVQFDLSGIPAGSTISKATLRLYVDAVTTAGSFDVYQVNTAWSEKTTYNSAPSIGASATGSRPTAIATSNLKNFVQIDITDTAQSWLAGVLPNNGVALQLIGTTGSFSFDSKEATTYSHEPELEIVLEGQAGQTGPQGPAGPAGPQGPQGPSGIATPGSTYYIQNGTTKQTSASFNIDGSGMLGGSLSANAVNSTTGYALGGTTILGTDKYNNIHLGANAGSSKATAGDTQAVGDNAGASITSGNADVFIGSSAGASTTTGNGDVFLGWVSGAYNTTGAYNSFVGAEAGVYNTTGTGNTFLGFYAGANNTTGGNNLFLGNSTGANNATGNNNVYLANQGANESNTIRIGSQGTQTAAYLAGAYGATASGAVPLFINSNGQLGTAGGTVVFSNTGSSTDGLVGNASQADGVNGNSSAANKSGVYGSNSINGGYGVTGRNTVDGSFGYLGANGVGVGGSSLNITGHATIGGGITVAGAIKAGNLVSINGFVDPDGSIFTGSGFTVTRNHAGNYTINFPAGSFTAFPITTFQSYWYTATPTAGGIVLNSDGSASMTVDFGGIDTYFMFQANQAMPGNLPAAGGPEANANATAKSTMTSPTVVATGNATKAATQPVVNSTSSAQASLHQALQQQVNKLQQENSELQQRLANLEAAVAKLTH